MATVKAIMITVAQKVINMGCHKRKLLCDVIYKYECQLHSSLSALTRIASQISFVIIVVVAVMVIII